MCWYILKAVNTASEHASTDLEPVNTVSVPQTDSEPFAMDSDSEYAGIDLELVKTDSECAGIDLDPVALDLEPVKHILNRLL